MVPSVPHDAGTPTATVGSMLDRSATSCGAPPGTRMRISFRFTKNASSVLSGDQNGKPPPGAVVEPGTIVKSSASSARIQSCDIPPLYGRPLTATNGPFGETATETVAARAGKSTA